MNVQRALREGGVTDVRQGTLNTQRMAVVVSTSVSILFSFILGQFLVLRCWVTLQKL